LYITVIYFYSRMILLFLLFLAQPVKGNPIAMPARYLSPSYQIIPTPSTPITTTPPITPPTDTSHPLIRDEVLLSLELISLILLLLSLFRFITIYLYANNQKNKVVLELCNGRDTIDIPLATVPRCPCEYELKLPYWITRATMTTQFFGPTLLTCFGRNFT
jgi:hypothetical protein